MDQPAKARHRRLLSLAPPLALHLLAFLLPAFDEQGTPRPGYEMFWLGFWGSLSVVYLPWSWPWLANPAFYVGCYYLATGRARDARRAGTIATALAMGFFVQYGLWLGAKAGRGLPLQSGYYVWVSGMALLAVTGRRLTFRRTTAPPTPRDVR
jgi:hypothetical protein